MIDARCFCLLNGSRHSVTRHAHVTGTTMIFVSPPAHRIIGKPSPSVGPLGKSLESSDTSFKTSTFHLPADLYGTSPMCTSQMHDLGVYWYCPTAPPVRLPTQIIENAPQYRWRETPYANYVRQVARSPQPKQATHPTRAACTQ